MPSSQNSKRHISVWTASAFVISCMIGTGVFTSLGFQLQDIQSVFPLLILWIIGGITALFGALTYSELAAALPRSGGEYHLLSRIIHPAIGFVGGLVSSTVGFAAPAVLAAMALGNYLSAVFIQFTPTMVAVIALIFFHLLHGISLKYGTLFQDGATAVKIGLILIFIFAGLWIANPQEIYIFPKPGDMALILSPGFAVSLVWVSYAYTGWNSTVYIAGEVKNPKQNISRSLLLSTGFVMILYVLLNYVFLYAAPMEAMEGKVEVGYVASIRIFGELGADIIGIGISILLVSTVSSYVYIGPRILQVMGEDHSYIGFLAKKNDQGIPVNSFLLQFVISMLFILSSSFEQVLLYTGISLILSTTATVIGVFVLRNREPELDRPYKAWGYPWTPGIFILVNLWILFYTFKEQPFESFIGLGIFGASMGVYYIGKKFNKGGMNNEHKNKTILRRS
ncbi:MAG: amino acid permease [Candidatus Marinimicrobia bacterium]|jgi:basic amino acid/polyamine antiporter, APA family|nr:amino acid permease [Candidatus Neomarinimicrobiota bacterium]MBT3948447.1 amino acid permease [Candidatus Neomarinimicrobiota bacterium]MBT4065319.1 amino acid permease [Candidatus Neomarinimicrobiota bacterium]MBT4307163.1 amino acid permease [Candidatus Neomarinimicrobiota bacterium]MBT4453473.1 amino acid permease [Candidatus Neomarinimicrobiota bacterium]